MPLFCFYPRESGLSFSNGPGESTLPFVHGGSTRQAVLLAVVDSDHEILAAPFIH